MKVAVSVVIPCYNAAAFLARAVDSVLAQTFPAAEIILVDDGSTDSGATREVGESYAARYPGIVRYIHKPNGGVSSARNLAIREARHEWIALLDADDWWKPQKLALQIALLDRSPQPDLIYTTLHIFPEDPDIEPSLYSVPLGGMWPALRLSNRITPSSVMLRRSLVLDTGAGGAGGFAEHIHGAEDWEMWVRLIVRKQIRIAKVDDAVTCYRLAQVSACRQIDGMMAADLAALDTTLIADLHGLHAAFWRRRILAHIYHRAALNARAAGDPRELRFALRSILVWPSPWLLPLRFKSFFVSLTRRRTSPSA